MHTHVSSRSFSLVRSGEIWGLLRVLWVSSGVPEPPISLPGSPWVYLGLPRPPGPAWASLGFPGPRRHQKGPERPREATRSAERPREAQRGPGRQREAHGGRERSAEVQRSPMTFILHTPCKACSMQPAGIHIQPLLVGNRAALQCTTLH